MADSMYTDGQYLANNENWHEEDSPYKVKLVDQILSRNNIQPATIADVGCGAGKVAELLAQKYSQAQVTGFDISPDAARFWAKREAPNLKYRQASYADAEETFDVAVCLDVFEHVEDYYGFLRALRPRSKYIVFNIPLDLSVLKLLTPGLRIARESVGHIHYFNAYSAEETVKDTGYQVVDKFLANQLFHDPPHNFYQWLTVLPRMLVSVVSKPLAAKLVGGHSLVVLAKC